MNSKRPPSWPKRMLTWLIDDRHIDILLGDLQELYTYRLNEKGVFWARLHYIKDAFDVMRPFALKNFSFIFNNHHMMYKNYFKVSVRNMNRNRVYTTINLLGLAVGIASFLLIFLYVQHELSYDSYHEHADRTYRVVVRDLNPNGEIGREFTNASPMHAKVLREDYPQVASSVRFNPWNFPIVKHGDKQFEESLFNFVEPSIFEIFSFDFLEGTSHEALSEPFSLVITASCAKKYFGEKPAYGQTLIVVDGDIEAEFKITGVVNDFPEQSHMSYDFLASWITYENFASEFELNNYYGNYNFPTYFRIKEVSDISALEAQMPAMLDHYIDDIDGLAPSKKVGIVFQKLTDIHLDGSDGAGGTNYRYYVKLFSVIGILILIIACINYMNLATAKYARRHKEIGVRKVLGAHSNHISQQFLIESFCYTLVALIIGLAMIYLALPFINDFTGKTLILNPLNNIGLILPIIGLAIFVAILSGIYPALFMAKMKAVAAIKNEKTRNRRSWFETSLVIFQFAITVALIIGVFVVDRQINFIQNKDVGYDRESIVNFRASPSMIEDLDPIKNRLKSNPNVVSVSASSRIPTGRLADAMDARIVDEGVDRVVEFRLPFLRVDEDYLEVYDMKLAAGEGFKDRTPSDDDAAFILNETAVKKLGWKSPAAAVGQQMRYGRSNGFVTGVVKDFNFESLHSVIQPMILLHHERFLRTLSIKITESRVPETLKILEREFKLYNPARTFNARFIEDLYNAQYAGEHRLSTITKVFSLIAIIIACSGLLGLVAFSMEKRSKEICVRKVLGASASNILVMVSKRYLYIILISYLIAVPTVYYFLMDWLNSFEYRVSIGFQSIAIAGLLATTIALLTIWSQSLKFALASPHKWLRSE